MNEIEIGGRVFRFPETNKWRCAWAENFCLDLAHEIPDEVNESVVLKYLERYGMRGGEEGCCLQFCMNPQNRYYDKSYCRGPRRKKEVAETRPKKLRSQIDRILSDAGVDLWAVGETTAFDDEPQVNPQSHLPDAATLISIGTRLPKDCEENPEFASVVRRRLQYASFDVAHHLDLAGYSAVMQTKIFNERVAQVLGVYETNVQFTTVLTDAQLPSGIHLRPKCDVVPSTEAIRAFCHKLGADLVGFFSTKRFERFRDALENTGLPPTHVDIIEDAGMVYGPHVPRIRSSDGKIETPADHLSGAKSVVVLGMHFPDATLDIAKTTPAETVGPFAFVRYEAQRLLGDIAFKLVQSLGDSGHRASFTYDLTGLASTVHSSRGMLPDMRSNRFAAVLAGLAYIGLNGCPITAEFGTRQVFVAVVTDLEAADDPLYAGEFACETCEKPCIRACPTSALGGQTVSVKLDGETFRIPQIDSFACDWAKRYCLAGEEGPRYCGLNVDVVVPTQRTAQAVAAAVSKINWGVQKRHTNIVEECIRVCPARGSSRRRTGIPAGH